MCFSLAVRLHAIVSTNRVNMIHVLSRLVLLCELSPRDDEASELYQLVDPKGC